MGEKPVKSRRKAAWRILVGTGSLIALGVYLNRPIVIRSHRNSGQTSSIRNLRQIGISLFEFEKQYGTLPDSGTATEVKRKSRTGLTLSDRSSNDVFVQLIASELSEELNFETHSESTKRPDGICKSDATALAPGETGFAYISGLSFEDNPSLPLAFGPVIPGTTHLDPTAFDGRAVVLQLDCSVHAQRNSPDGNLVDSNGQDLLDPDHPIWGGRPFPVKWPK